MLELLHVREGQVMDRLSRSDADATVGSILQTRTRCGRLRLTRQFTREVLQALTKPKGCTDHKYTVREVLKLWKKVGL